MAAPHLHIQTIDKLRFLYEPHRYKVIYGGRGGLKSWSVAQALPILGMQRPLRVICGRETQSSIRESVHQLLENRIRSLGLLDYYEVLQYTIRARHPNANNARTEFIFTGLRDEDVRNIKSLEAADVLWVEEATNVSKYSWETIIPTVRKPGSEIWVTFNPELTTDDTYRRFVIHPPPTAKVVRTWFYENPWLPDEMRIEAEHLQKTDPPAYEHVWMGECRSQVEGAIFADELKRATEENRIGSFPVDRTRPVHTFWDLGYGDDTAIWFAQIIGGWYHVVDYYENHGKTIEHYVIQLQNKGYLYGTDWLPHDAVDAIIHKKLAGDRSRSIEQLMRHAGRKVRVAAKLHVTDRINAARTIFSQLRFDEGRCQDGLQPLHHYQWGPLNAKGESRREPLHNWASHASDALCTLAVSIKPEKQPIHQPMPEPYQGTAWG